ncbi:hypothetical protein GE21DRAFT_10554 [Neurospora crassa]|uniref:Uncharacterized protein n=1 Tax=Neurospora crassa (strain ATCC 24698 / 74-OR23-1A / CBS 708.71 / DSM 1257 / FGSC 987) TaxID=367110 RepID=Q7S3Z0_NEUCR|nr:hypothetical protein NCU08140 [Neurospora crassa OR74A]EAA30211.1 hypothetical protein NCU08140 [Neurospora crassa OR74A]KHE79196.1 hypothetical protein GE21DRAFT_10554 [Neurospora crassa]|eukprot:XP_959447.1 hypothetical protein NCU08140 [Neurospora crassa OR74A]
MPQRYLVKPARGFHITFLELIACLNATLSTCYRAHTRNTWRPTTLLSVNHTCLPGLEWGGRARAGKRRVWGSGRGIGLERGESYGFRVGYPVAWPPAAGNWRLTGLQPLTLKLVGLIG